MEQLKKHTREIIKHYENGAEHYKKILEMLSDPRFKEFPDTKLKTVTSFAIKSAKSEKVKNNELTSKNTSKLIREMISDLGRPMTRAEILKRMLDFPGSVGHEDRTRRALTALFGRDELIRFNYKKSKYFLYALPSDFDENGKLKESMNLSPEMIDDISADEVVIENIIIHNKK